VTETAADPGWRISGLAGRRQDVIDRLRPGVAADPIPTRLSWLLTGAVAVLAALLRWPRLGQPADLVFDEVYYAKDAWALVTTGVEVEVDLGTLTRAGDERVLAESASFVVHPPLGKWLIGVGELLVGITPTGWRVTVAVLGVLAVILLARIARRLTGSTVLGTLAGLLLAVDGLAIVMSRTALLDGILMVALLAAFGCLLCDRDWTRSRLAEQLGAGAEPDRVAIGWRPWLWGAGALLGCALATKWSAVWFILVLAVMWLLWEAGALRLLGVRAPFARALMTSGGWGVAALGVVPGAVYLLSWSGWFLTDRGYGRADAVGPVEVLMAWLTYQRQALTFHSGLTADHSYQAGAWLWPLLLRPTAFAYDGAAVGCGTGECVTEVIALANPILWWLAIAAVVWQAWRWLADRDWRSGAVLSGVLAGWVPWLFFPARTTFAFYTIVVLPFLILALVLTAGSLLGTPGDPPRRRQLGAGAVGVVVVACLIATWFFFPVWTSLPMPRDEWGWRMWLPSWI